MSAHIVDLARHKRSLGMIGWLLAGLADTTVSAGAGLVWPDEVAGFDSGFFDLVPHPLRAAKRQQRIALRRCYPNDDRDGRLVSG